jgi:hypothetical protein
MTRDLTTQERRDLAEQELLARGLIKFRYPAGMRLIMRLFPEQKAPYYGDHGRYGLQLGAMFAIPFTAFLLFVGSLSDDVPILFFLLMGLGAGAAFGAIFGMMMKAIHRRMKLTPWAELGTRPSGEIPDGAATFKEIEAEYFRRPLTSGLRDHLREQRRK